MKHIVKGGSLKKQPLNQIKVGGWQASFQVVIIANAVS